MKLRRQQPPPEQLRLPLGEVARPGRSAVYNPPSVTGEARGRTDAKPRALVAPPGPPPIPEEIAPAEPDAGRISDLTRRFLEFSTAIDRSAYTLEALGLDLLLLLRFLGDRFATEISLDDLRQFVIWLRQERQNDRRSLRRKVASVKAFFSYLRESGFRSDDPAEGLVYPTLDPHLPEILEADEELRLVAAADRPLWRALLMLLLDAGLKRDEVLALHPADIYLDPVEPSRGYLVVQATDRARRLRPRTLRLTHRLAEELGRIQMSDGERVFDISARAVNFIVETCAERAGLRKRGTVSPQMLRDTFAWREVRRRVAIEHERRLTGASANDLATLRQRHDAEVCDLLGLAIGDTNNPIRRYRVLCPEG